MPTTAFDEEALRRTPFSEGYRVELADGQGYRFPAIRVFGSFPHEREDGTIDVVHRPRYADECGEDLDLIFGVTPARRMDVDAAEIRLAAGLLKQNYDLPKGAIARLLPRLWDDEANVRMWDRIVLAILGRDPATAGGDGKPEEADAGPKGEATAPGSP